MIPALRCQRTLEPSGSAGHASLSCTNALAGTEAGRRIQSFLAPSGLNPAPGAGTPSLASLRGGGSCRQVGSRRRQEVRSLPSTPQGSHHSLLLPLESLPFRPNRLLQADHIPLPGLRLFPKDGHPPLFNNNQGAQGRKGQARESSDITTPWVVLAPVPDLPPKTLHQPPYRHLLLPASVPLPSQAETLPRPVLRWPLRKVWRGDYHKGAVWSKTPTCHLTKSIFSLPPSPRRLRTYSWGSASSAWRILTFIVLIPMIS